MKPRRKFILTVLLLFVMSLADVTLFGTSEYRIFPAVVNQAAHFVCLLFAGWLGYRYWRDTNITAVWVAVYVLVIAVVALFSVLFYLLPAINKAHLRQSIASIRTTFCGPLPMLVFYLMNRMFERR